jgi:DNA primase
MAGRIPQQFIDDLLTRIDIIDVIDGYVPLRKAGRNHQARCPFHEEKTPSFTVSQEKQFYHCFGCGANGTAISFLMNYAGMDFIDAIEDLAARAGLEVPHEGSRSSSDQGITELYELMEMVVRYYCRQLREHPDAAQAIGYLKARGIDGQLAAKFELGYAPPGWENLVSALGGSNAALLRLAKTGMVINRDNGGYYDRFRDRIIYPIRDLRGRVIGVGGRVLDDSIPKYLNSPETPIFHKGRELYGLYQVRRSKTEIEQLYVVEGYMDVLALAQHEIQNAVATLGTAITDEHLQRLFKICPRLVFCFDGDDAGQKAAWRALEIALPLLRDGRQVQYLFMPAGEDPDSYIRQHGPAKFTDPATQVPLSDHLLNTLRHSLNMDNREDRALLAEKTMIYLANMPTGALQELLLKDLAALCQLHVDSLRQLVSSKKPALINKNRRKQQKVQLQRKSNINLVSKAIRLLLHNPEIARNVHVLENIKNIDDHGVKFLHDLMQFICDNPESTCAGILEHWRGTRYEQRLNELATMENLLAEGELIEKMDIRKEFLDYISKIEQSFNRKQRERQSRDINNLDQLRRLFGKEQESQKD